jgi:acetyltransferase-like isoleucine patch superfamily enzyme
MKAWIKRNWYRFKFRKLHLELGEKVLLNMRCDFEGYNVLGNNTEISTSKIGLGTYICANSVIRFTHIGRFCSIGKNLQAGLGTHPSSVFVSTHPAFFSPSKQSGFTFVDKTYFKENRFVDEKTNCIVAIGNDVWIGNDVTIMDGLTVGDGAIIATGAVVTKNVEPYAIIGGVPAKLIDYRFPPDDIKWLLKLKWWNWDFAKIKDNSLFFKDISELKNVIKDN